MTLTEEDLAADVPEPVDVVWTGLSFEASRSDGCFPTQNAGVWHSAFKVTFFITVLTAEAYDEAAGEEDEDEGTTIRLASPYERHLTVLTRWISFS